MTRKLLAVVALCWAGQALACKCTNGDSLEAFGNSQVVAFGRVGPLEREHQRLDVTVLLKGAIPKGGLQLSPQDSSCKLPLLPLATDTEYLFFLSESPNGLQFNTRCFVPSAQKGLFSLRLGDQDVSIHRTMVGEFFKTRGLGPRLELHPSFSVRDGHVETWLSIKNLEDHEVTVYAPWNREAFVFFVLDALGNVVAPEGNAKVDPPGGELRIAAAGVYNHHLEPSSALFFPYLSGSAQFGYALKTGQRYRVHALYRPFGTSHAATWSREFDVTP